MKSLKLSFATIVFIFTLLYSMSIMANAASSSTCINDSIKGCLIRTTVASKAYSDSITTKASDSIATNERLTVLAEDNNRFLVIYHDKEVWIDVRNVLVNIAQYIPSLEIDLAMSRPNNYFQMGDEQIQSLSNHQFYTAPGSVNGSEAWLRYETAKKLLNAEMEFEKDGYSIIIYDAYRPYSVTKDFQSTFRSYLNTKSNDFKNYWFGELGESWFLAQKASSHNYGVAVDMGLVDNYSGMVVKMPSPIHTLDKRSAYYFWSKSDELTSANALYLKNVMEHNGFTYLKSEWWHFQDNSISRDSVINIPN